MAGKLKLTFAGVALTLALAAFALQMWDSLFDYFTQAYTSIRYPYSLDYGEGPMLDQTLRMARFENIYQPSFVEPPYSMSNYPPLFILAQVPLAWGFGPSFWYGRLISIASMLLTAVLIFLTLRALTHQWIGAAVGALTLMAFPYVQFWSMFDRIDSLALALSWAALYATVRHIGLPEPEQFRRRGFWAAVVLFVASIYTRQTYALAAPLAAFVWLVFMRRTRRAFELGLAVGGSALVLFLLLNLLTQGGFYMNIVVANVNSFYWETVEKYVKDIRERLYILLIAALLFMVGELFAARGRTRAWALVTTYLLTAAAGSLTIGKDGSNVNYLYEFSAALSLATGAAISWLGSLSWSRRRWLQFALIVAVAYQISTMVEWTRDSFIPYTLDRVAKRQSIDKVFQMFQAVDGPVLADEYMGLIPLAGKSLYLQPFEYKQMYDAGMWDQRPLLEDIADHKFDIILWYRPNTWRAVELRWTQAQRDAITTYYERSAVFNDIEVYTPLLPDGGK